jgi:adenylosuccinate lyase
VQNIIFNYGIEETFTALDGRNRHKLTALLPYLSELALDKYRIFVETTYIETLCENGLIRKLKANEKVFLKNLSEKLDLKAYKAIRIIELETNHEMKSVELYIQKELSKTSMKDIFEMIHFGLTSEDINNSVYALMFKNACQKVLLPELETILSMFQTAAKDYKSIVMLGRTHGQPAVPTTVGKEFLCYYKRLADEIDILKTLKIKAKLTGNVGNLNAHKYIYPDVDWLNFVERFITQLGLEADPVTTQIEPYDSLIRLFQSLSRINNILTGFCIDFWLYISMDYFKQQVIKKEVGSTALPHKVNPIYFEGAEGGFGIANALFEFYTRKLSYSRMQRDLSDSTVRRSVNIAFSYTLLSYQSVIEALKRICPNEETISEDLNKHWEILSEAAQNFLRMKGYDNAYEKTKLFFRGKQLSKEDIKVFINSLDISSKDKKYLKTLTPESYTGYAEKLVDKYAK